MKYAPLIAGLVIGAFVVPTAHAQATYKREMPDSLAKLTKIAEKEAATTAQKRVPTGTIDAVELEREKGKLIYSYELKVPGKSGITEVNVDAITGKIIGISHESGADEAKEAAAEAKAKTKKP